MGKPYVRLYRERPSALSGGVPLLLALWAAAIGYVWQVAHTDVFLTVFIVGVSALLSALLFFLQHWFLSVRALLNYSSADLSSASTVLFSRGPNHKAELCRIERSPAGPYFWHQQRKYVWGADGVPQRFAFPDKGTVQSFQENRGITSEEAVVRAQKWGTNSVSLPTPSFRQLYREHATAPFFVLQMFFVLLWCLDEYWMYAIVTGVLLGLMEALTVWKRLNTIRFLRSMVQVPEAVNVLRSGKWSRVPGTDVVPGDVLEIAKSQQKKDGLAIPCDCALISGSCVVSEAALTGENVALVKESLASRRPEDSFDIREDRVNVLFGGTRLLQTKAAAGVKTPQNGCVAVALRTGFSSSQGRVLRTIAYASETLSANSVEALFFILFLLQFALLAAGYVLKHGLEDPDKSRYKLLLECIIILTSVVPPELPIELSLAITASLQALRLIKVFCTEPFRIPLAGKLDVCAFDKTGTLTRDDLLYKGAVWALGGVGSDGPKLETGNKSLSADLLLAIGGCQGLCRVDNTTVGDPLESAAFDGTGWKVLSETDAVHNAKGLRAEVVYRLHFSAALRRMTTVIVASSAQDKPEYRVCVKGAPEVIRALLRREDQTPEYDALYKYYANRGFRVIAFASRPFTYVAQERSLADTPREELEQGLSFNGLLVFECPLREGTTAVLQNLKDAGMFNIMITGDSELTACAVAVLTGMSQLPRLVLSINQKSGGVEWVAEDDSTHEFRVNSVKALASKHMLCVTGTALDAACGKSGAPAFGHVKWFQYVRVWARCSPANKETILAGLGQAGCYTLMCGDGTNDVGALKRSHVGVAMVFRDEPEVLPEAQVPAKKVSAAANDPFVKRKVKKEDAATATASVAGGAAGGPAVERVTGVAIIDKFLHLQSMQETQVEKSLTMGDASIAAPFTIHGKNVGAVTDIIRQGRCTLVTTLQMYFILALNSLVTAYALSVLHLKGVRFGDAQMTVGALVTTFCFLFISRAKPLQRLYARKPQNRIFSAWFLFNLLGQFAIHLASLIGVVSFAEVLVDKVALTKAQEFAPNVLNTTVFLLSTVMALNTFSINYQGHPFMESLWDNKPLRNCLGFAYAFMALATMGSLNKPLQLALIPGDLKQMILGIMLADAAGCWVWNKLVSLVFSRFNEFKIDA